MKHGALIVRLLLFAVCVYLFFALLERNDPMRPNAPMPFLLAAISWIDLFIHEAGHLFFGVFGRFMNILGGSVMQLLIPLVSVVVLFRTTRLISTFALFWLGENFVNVSIYVRDATRMKLRLISPAATHDWNYLLGQLNLLGATDSIADVIFSVGLIVCLTGIVYGAFVSFQLYLTKESDEQVSFGSGVD